MSNINPKDKIESKIFSNVGSNKYQLSNNAPNHRIILFNIKLTFRFLTIHHIKLEFDRTTIESQAFYLVTVPLCHTLTAECYPQQFNIHHSFSSVQALITS